MAKMAEPRLCRECPLPESTRKQISQTLLNQQYTREREQPTTLKECLARRTYLRRLGLHCPYFPNTETLIAFIGR